MKIHFEFIIKLLLISLLKNELNCSPINIGEKDIVDELPLEIRVLQNPDLFGGDIMGIDKNNLISKPFNALVDKDRLWPLATIPYVLDSDQDDFKKEIMLAMNQYHEKTCIRFVERSDEYDYIYITKQNGCYSYVGRTGGRQIVSLADGCHSIGTITHELGHAVGFYHEHQRTDRDNNIDIFWDNIAKGLNDQFDKLDQDRLYVNFDFSSVMLYGPLTFSKDGKSKTMLPKSVYKEKTMLEVYQKYGLSELDIEAIKKLYQC